jgi:beta-glucuronidase
MMAIVTSGTALSKSTHEFPLSDKGVFPIIPYEKYGTFSNKGKLKYDYHVNDTTKLAQAAGAGIFPNFEALRQTSRFRTLSEQGKLKGVLSDFSPMDNPELAFYKWGTHKPIPKIGLRQFVVAQSLELGGHPRQALKAYYAVVVHFPKDVMWDNGKPWYIGVSALDAVKRLIQQHPEWDLHLDGAFIEVKNGFDRKGTNDRFVVDPGQWGQGYRNPDVIQDLSGFQKMIGQGRFKIVQRDNGHWQAYRDGTPHIIRGMCYIPTPVGKTPDWGGYMVNTDWMVADENSNDQIDGPFDTWVDTNRNNKMDGDDWEAGDFQLMLDMGVNTVRLYHHATNRELLRILDESYGIQVVMGDLLGSYTMGSGASWEEGTDYENKQQLKMMNESVKKMVLDHKDEHYVLVWMLGNENNYGNGNNADKKPKAYYKFANSVAKMIKKLDPSRPVALCNGDLENLDIIAEVGSHIDILGVNVYRGPHGTGESFWHSLKDIWGKPVLISEFGAPAYHKSWNSKAAEAAQADYLLGNWTDIENHMAGTRTGNAIGGMLFEWVDEWWKAGPKYDPFVQDTHPQSKGPFPDGNMYEEWLGITNQGDGESSPFLRQLRPAYQLFKEGPWKHSEADTLKSRGLPE